MYVIIKKLDKLFDIFGEYKKRFFIKKNNNWCKWLLSGWMGDFLIKSFLIIENKVSKAGYHKSNTIKNGDKYWWFW